MHPHIVFPSTFKPELVAVGLAGSEDSQVVISFYRACVQRYPFYLFGWFIDKDEMSDKDGLSFSIIPFSLSEGYCLSVHPGPSPYGFFSRVVENIDGVVRSVDSENRVVHFSIDILILFCKRIIVRYFILDFMDLFPVVDLESGIVVVFDQLVISGEVILAFADVDYLVGEEKGNQQSEDKKRSEEFYESHVIDS
ncbi:hypothetical protein ES703_80076 [subsurface metagenome]